VFVYHLISLLAVIVVNSGSTCSKADQHSATTDLERRTNTRNESGMQLDEDVVMEEMRLRRWSAIKRTTSEI
jgi:hypothetical protein